MDPYTTLLWLLIALIAVLVFAIDAGLAARHKRVVLSSMLAAVMAVIYLMVLRT